MFVRTRRRRTCHGTAGLSMLANFLFIPVYPVWALTIITINVLVIWALTAHGGEMRTR